MSRLFDKNAPQNVHGWERAASVAGGLILLGKGVRRGGIGGALEFAMGAAALVRGLSGRCQAKRLFTDTPAQTEGRHAYYSHMPLDSEVRSPDFEDADVQLPDTVPMGNERAQG
jgi:hypothetical protein